MPHHAYLLATLGPWMSSQRWFAGKGHTPDLDRIGGWALPSTDGSISTHLIIDRSGVQPVLYQVPVAEYPRLLHALEHAFIGTTIAEGGETRYLYDGAHDPVFAAGLLSTITSGGAAIPDGASAHGFRLRSSEPFTFLSAKVMTGEQSNTSIIYRIATPRGEEDVICKVFRMLHHGENPDVVLQGALAASGSLHVPGPIGSLVGEWADPGRPDGRASGHLAFAQEFLAGAEDGWHYAMRTTASGADFSDKARRLGLVTAEVHNRLATIFPSRASIMSDVDNTAESWRRRLELAVAEVPAVRELVVDVERLYDAARTAAWPQLQRIHGDYHLGQVLLTEDERWVILDFEGEPMRAMKERSQPDFAVRDVAGMLRSFDYVSATHGASANAQRWADGARREFMSGYIDASGPDVGEFGTLLDAFEVDKAIYEAVYESRNRPSWLPIPLRALRRLVARENQY